MFPHEWRLLKRAEIWIGSLLLCFFFWAGTGAKTSILLYLMTAVELMRLQLILAGLRCPFDLCVLRMK